MTTDKAFTVSVHKGVFTPGSVCDSKPQMPSQGLVYAVLPSQDV